jgi:hypothetical protein
VGDVPSVTWKEIEAGPKYWSAEVNWRVRESTTSDVPSEWVAVTELESVSWTFLPWAAIT